MYFKVRVYPRSNHTSIKVDNVGLIKVHFSVAPVDGKANALLIELLAKSINWTKSKISIVMGLNSRNKLLEIIGFNLGDIEKIFT